MIHGEFPIPCTRGFAACAGIGPSLQISMMGLAHFPLVGMPTRGKRIFFPIADVYKKKNNFKDDNSKDFKADL